MEQEVLTRREVLKGGAAAALTGALFLSYSGVVFGQSDNKTRVVLIRSKNVLDEFGNPRGDIVQQMLDAAITALLDEKDSVQAWKSLVGPADIVGIKTNVWRFLPTPPSLERAIRTRLIGAGVPEKNIGIRDRGLLADPIFLNATALINVRPLRTHHWSGVGSLIKNYITFVRRPSAYHADSCADLATIWKLPIVEGKTRLNMLVLLTPLFHGIGPHHFNPEYTLAYRGLLVGLDPVAVDSTGVRILLAKRREFFGEVRPLNPPPKHILLADTRHHLGTADPEKIDLIRLGWSEGILI
jgi:hypothetical protein